MTKGTFTGSRSFTRDFPEGQKGPSSEPLPPAGDLMGGGRGREGAAAFSKSRATENREQVSTG